MTTAAIITPRTRRSTVHKKTYGGWETGRTQNMPRVVHTHPFPEIISSKMEANILGRQYTRGVYLNKKGIIDCKVQ